MQLHQRIFKRGFDLCVASLGLLVTWPVIVATVLLARRETGASGLFRQQRIGRHAKPFTVYKIRTMRAVEGTTVTTAGDARITPLGAKLRRWKLDELPQLWNVVRGDMSFVGPRPDVAGFADLLQGEDREVLELRPGITGPATLKYRDEESILAAQSDPEGYNKDVIWPDKVAINLEYLRNYRFTRDLGMIWQTVSRR